jgi:hypothetical protein
MAGINDADIHVLEPIDTCDSAASLIKIFERHFLVFFSISFCVFFVKSSHNGSAGPFCFGGGG